MKTKLETVCTKLPSTWKTPCTNFVSTKFQNIIDMLVAQVKPEEVCILLEICKPKSILESGDVGKWKNINLIRKILMLFTWYFNVKMFVCVRNKYDSIYWQSYCCVSWIQYRNAIG